MSTRTYLIGQGYDNLRKHGGKTFSTMLIICATMFILGLFIILFVNIESNVKTVSMNQGLQAFVSDDVPDSKINELATKISGISNVKNIKYIDKEEALEDAKSTLKDYSYLLDGMDNTNPFPRSFVITFNKLENTKTVKESIESVDGIYKVSYNEKIIDAVVSISKIGNYAIICIGIVMMTISIFIISNTIKLAVYSNKREIYIMKYIGATSKFIKYPFIVEGIIMGLASAAFSWVVVSLSYSIAYRFLPKVGAELGVFGFVGYSTMWYIVLIAFTLLGIFLGGVGSAVATRKYLKEFRPIKIKDKDKSKEVKEEKTERVEDKKQEAPTTNNLIDKSDLESKVETPRQRKEREKLEAKRQKAELKLKRENLKKEEKANRENKRRNKEEFERKRKARRLNVFILLLVIATVFSPYVNAASTQDKINEIDKKTSEAAKKYEQVQNDIKVYEKDIEGLETEVEKYQSQVDTLSDKVEKAKADVENIDRELQNISTNYDATEQLLNTRLRVLYENGFVSMWEVLFSAENITDFLAKYNVLATLIENDKKTLTAMQDQKKYIQNLRETADLKRLQVEQVEFDVQKSKDALETAKANKAQKLNNLETSKKELKDMMAQLRKDRAKQEAILAAEIEAARNQGKDLIINGEFAWPAPGVYYITALFRDREYYEWSGSVHGGTDIAKSGGCNIVAAQSGKVVVASTGSYNGGYGNYIVIEHGKSSKDGNRYTTLYAHLASVSVKVGQTVVKGQKIGYMGSTGWSTGTHLHFEIRKNGTRVNAMNYYTELAGTARYLYHNSWMAFPFGNMAKYQI